MTERAEFTFVVKEGDRGTTPWIAAEPLGRDMPSLRGLLGFDLVPGTTLEQARGFAKYMRENIRGLSLTP